MKEFENALKLSKESLRPLVELKNYLEDTKIYDFKSLKNYKILFNYWARTVSDIIILHDLLNELYIAENKNEIESYIEANRKWRLEKARKMKKAGR